MKKWTSSQSIFALNCTILLIAGLKAGIGPFLALYLKSNLNWDPYKTHKELFEENTNLKYKLKHVPKTKESKVIVTQAHVRGFLARKHYKHELHMKEVQKEIELHKKEIKEEITKALQNNDYSTVGTLSTLLNQNKIEDAMQIIHGQKNLISFNK